jgi:hypothetical protein
MVADLKTNGSVTDSHLFLETYAGVAVCDGLDSVRASVVAVFRHIVIDRDPDGSVDGDGLVPNLPVVAIRGLASTISKKTGSKNRKPESYVSNS